MAYRREGISAAERKGETMKDKSIILQLSTFPASKVELGEGLVRFRKELIKVGKYTKESTKQEFEVTLSTLRHWVGEFHRWITNGNKVPIPLGHEREDKPEYNRGWVVDMFIEGNSLFGLLDLSDPSLALTTDVSIAIPYKFVDGKGIEYTRPIAHVALTTKPVIGGLKDFEKLSLSLSKGTNMEFLKKIREKLGLSVDAKEGDVLTALEKVKPEDKRIELSQDSNASYVVKMLSENRANKLSNLLKAGMITPAVKDVITAKYVETEALTLSMSSKTEDGFDVLYDILVQNHPVKLEELTGVQSLELANRSVAQPNVMEKVVNEMRKDAGLDT